MTVENLMKSFMEAINLISLDELMRNPKIVSDVEAVEYSFNLRKPRLPGGVMVHWLCL